MSVEFKQVDFSYGKTYDNAIYDINLKVNNKDEFITILGHTGSGKSTLMQHINGLVIPKSGTVNVFDNIITPKKRKNPKMKLIRKKIGYVFQFPEYQLFEETVLKDIMFGPMNFGFTESEAKESAIKYAKLLKIEHLLERSPFELSGGQMRKVAVCGVLAYEPEILLLDEPTRGLDPASAKEMMEFFNKMNKEFNKSIIMITHDMDIAYEYATRMIVLKEGKIKFDGNKEELFKENLYKEYHLSKPLILNLIDEINSIGININYNITNEKDLLSKLKEVI